MEFTVENLNALILEKEKIRKDIPSFSKEINLFYKSLKGLSLAELQLLFPAQASIIEKSNFDCMNEIISDSGSKDLLPENTVSSLMSMFSFSNISQTKTENFEADTKLLQAIFFFFLRDIAVRSNQKLCKYFDTALSRKVWYKPEVQAEILNQICAFTGLIRRTPYQTTDFTKLSGKHFKSNECILRLFYNFMRDKQYIAEGIINELNFVREQQRSILDIWPNTKKTNFNSSDAQKEIDIKNKNFEILKKLDFGINYSNFKQTLFKSDKALEKSIKRPITIKCFPESEWIMNPEFKGRKNNRRKIIANYSERASIKSALSHKFLYSERNILTHMSENFAVYKLFTKIYPPDEENFRNELFLHSLFDARQYLIGLEKSDVRDELIKILNHYFSIIVSKTKLSSDSVEEIWNEVFDKNGNCTLNPDDLSETNVSSILDEDQLIHFKKFMNFLYCSESSNHDFFVRNSFRFELYLIYLTFEIAKLDK